MERREKKLAAIVLVGTSVVVLAICEMLLRSALFSDWLVVSTLRQPWRYADATLDENYWKLRVIFNDSAPALRVETAPAGRIDADLGWAPPQTGDNPLGLTSDTPYRVEDIDEPVLFYGDSFVAGAGLARMSHRIPQLLDRRLATRPVLNYGVGGYGLDQVFIRFRSTVDTFDDPLVLVGILTDDVDRSIFGIRIGPKPYFEIADGELVVRNTPVELSPDAYVASNPPSISSYLARFVMFRLRSVLPKRWFDGLLGYDDIHRNNLEVNRRILEEMRSIAEDRGITIACVLFYSREEIHAPADWRETFLMEALDRAGIPYFDSKQHLQQALSFEGLTPDDVYYDVNNHLNERGNTLVADGIAAWLAGPGHPD